MTVPPATGTPPESERIRQGELVKLLRTRWLGRELHCLDEVDSTNAFARDRARAGAGHGTVVLAERQTHGRGRLGRSWVSPGFKNLYLSVVLHPTEQTPMTWIGLAAGVALCDAVAAWHPAALKWPNDVLIGPRKVGGILTEVEGAAADACVVVGIGVNLNCEAEDFPPELRNKAGSLRMALGRPVDRTAFAARLLGALEERCDQLRQEGFAPLAAAWHERSRMNGRRVTVAAPEGEVSGLVLGLDADGALRLRLDSGDEYRVLAGDVTVVGGYGETGV